MTCGCSRPAAVIQKNSSLSIAGVSPSPNVGGSGGKIGSAPARAGALSGRDVAAMAIMTFLMESIPFGTYIGGRCVDDSSGGVMVPGIPARGQFRLMRAHD